MRERAHGIAQSETVDSPEDTASGALELSVLGPFSLTDPNGRPIDISSKKNRLLLAMMACSPRRSMSRDALAGLLWSAHGDEQARSSLRQALAVLRRELNGNDGALLTSTDGAVALHPTAVTVDADQFLDDVAIGTRASLERALRGWRGPFMGDVSAAEPEIEQWLRERREYFNNRYIAAMDQLIPLLDGVSRINVALRLVQADTLREGSHRQVMEALLASGEKAQALRHYENMRKLLRDELGVEPSPETQSLRNRIAATGHAAMRPASPLDAEPSPASAHATDALSTALSVKPSSRLFPGPAAALFVMAILFGGWFYLRPGAEPVTAPAIAILPFESLSGRVEDQRIANGLTIDTISDLSRYSDFRVMAKDSTDTYTGKAVDVRALGKDLAVSHVLKGTFQRDLEHIRVTAQLVDATTGETLWSDRYDRLIGDIFAIQSDVAGHIANSLGGREGQVGESMLAWARRKPPADLGAYELYLLAQETMYSDLSDEHLKQAQEILGQAIAKDPAFARAYARYANAFAWRATYEGNAADLFRQMVLYARKAVSLDPVDADAHAALGYALTLTGDPKTGEQHLDEALRLTPNAFDVLVFHACLDNVYGKAKEGSEAVDRAIAINPHYPAWAVPCLRLGAVLVGRHEDAIRIQSRQSEDEMNSDGFVVLAGSLASVGRMDEAAAIVARGLAKFPDLLSIERFALNRYWPSDASKVMVELMRKAGFPPCASAQELADIPTAVRLLECIN